MRNIFKKRAASGQINQFIEKYKIPREYLSINRKSISRGIGLGLFIAFIPMPFQMFAILALTPFIRFNVPIGIAMVWLSNPLTMPPMYYMEYQTGLYFLNQSPLPDIELTLDWFQNNIEEIVLPLYLGTFFYSLSVSLIAFLLINILWIRSIHEYKRLRKVRKWLRVVKQYRRFRKHREDIVHLHYDHKHLFNLHLLDDTIDKMRRKVKYNKKFVHLAHQYRDKKIFIKDHLKEMHLPNFKNPLNKKHQENNAQERDTTDTPLI
ncbi:MAG: DUF2062 domain-containing protein [Campylobacterales bacterium]|nr:DUF2062 domain-containing protein [Campylobacterales bacterium]